MKRRKHRRNPWPKGKSRKRSNAMKRAWRKRKRQGKKKGGRRRRK